MPQAWIKLRVDLDTDPRVLTMADLLSTSGATYIFTPAARDLLGVTPTITRNAMRDVTLASLFRLWRDANRHTRDGTFRHCTLDYLDVIGGIPGFGRALAAVGWAVEDTETHTVTLVNFLEMNTPAKESGTSAAARQKRYRDRLRYVTRDGEAPVTRDVTVTADRDTDTENGTPPLQRPQARAAGFPGTEAAARSMAETIGVPPDYAVTVWNEIEGRGGCDDRRNPVVNFASHLKARWNHKQDRQSQPLPRRSAGPNGSAAAPETDRRALYARYMAARDEAEAIRKKSFTSEAERQQAAARLHALEREITTLETDHNFTPPSR